MNNELNKLSKLAYAYFPDYGREWARRKFREMIHETRGLEAALKDAGFNGTTVSPRIRQVFFEYLGEP